MSGHDEILAGIVAVLGVAIGTMGFAIRNGYYAKAAAREATEVNKAVNNVGPGEHRLYDRIDQIALKQEDFDKRWGNLPADMDDAVSLAELLHSMNQRITDIQNQLPSLKCSRENP